MNKKFLSAILFGALMVTSTGTFVSCKDYDDDIENLQSQINNLATKSDVEAKLSQLQTALEAAKAESSANAAKIAAIKQCQCDVDAMMKKIQDAVDADMKKFADDINALIEQAEELVGEIADYVTDVELILTDGVAGAEELTALTVVEVKNTFGPNKELTFTDGKFSNFGGELVVRVSPTNAVPTAESISFINSKGETLDEIIEVGTPVAYEGVLSREGVLCRGAATGLWTIPYSFKAETKKAFDAAIATTKVKVNGETEELLYAVAVDNVLAAEGEPRNVVSGYDLTVGSSDYVGSTELWFKADGKFVSEIKNRYGLYNLAENKWADVIKGQRVDPTKNVTADKNDDRNEDYINLLSVKVGTPFEVVLTDAEGEALADEVKPYRFYVTLDKAFAQQDSEPSEINAWETYAKNTTGLDVLDTDGKVTITINDETAEGDVIRYSVYAVNYDGTLVDPDGKSFYVYVGTQAVTSVDLILDQVQTPFDWSKVSSKKAAFSTADWGRAKTWEVVSITEADGTKTTLNYAIGKQIMFYDKDDEAVTTVGTTVTKVAIEGVDPAELKDGVTYVATIAAKADKGVVATATINFTKALPAFPSEYVYPYTNVLQDNVLHIYPIASNDASKGKFEMQNVWHGLKESANEVLFVQTNKTDDAIKEILGKTYPEIIYPINNSSANRTTIGVDAKFVNPDTEKNPAYLTEIPAKVTYNYGAISLPFVDNDWAKEAKDWITTGENIKIVFRNYVADCNIEWSGDVPTLYYPGASGKTDTMPLSALKVTDWYGNAVDLSKNNDYFLKENVDIVLLTGNNVEDEYYDAEIVAESKTTGEDGEEVVVPAHIKFTSKVNKSQGTAVPTTLKVVIKDKFGYVVSKSDLAPFSMSFTK